MSSSTMMRGLRAGALAACVALLSACAAETPEALVQSARAYLAREDYPAAWIQLKNVLQRQPDNAEARYLLARTLAAFGDHAGALREYRAALKLGYPADAVYPGLARAMLDLGQFSEVLSELGAVRAHDKHAQAAILASIGEAQLALGRHEEARQTFAAALEREPGLPEARIGQARLLATGGQADAATRVLDALLAEVPSLPSALSLKADLLSAQGKADEAAAVLVELVKVAPRDGDARFALVSLLVRGNQLDRAAGEVLAWRKALPHDVRGRYFEALLALRNSDWRKAREASLEVLKTAPDHVPTLAIAGAAAFNLSSYAVAEDYFRRVLARHPGYLFARNLLVATYLRKGQPAKAEEALAPALSQAPRDPAVLRAAGEVALANNRLADAARYYGEALSLERDNVQLQTRLAQIRLQRGETERALQDLQSASLRDPNSYEADLALVAAYAGRRDYGKALAALAELERKQPDNPVTHDLKGALYMAMQDRKAARASLEKALELQLNYLPAARKLAQLDLADGDVDAATRRFADILQNEPGNAGALLALAQMQMAAGASDDEIGATLERAVRADAGSAAARIALIDFLARKSDPRTALRAAQAASAAMPDHPELLEALGVAQLRAGETYQAIATFNAWARVQPDSPAPLLRLAAAEVSAKRHDAALQALRKALAIRGDLPQALLDIALVQVAAGRPAQALDEARAVQSARPREAIGFAMEAGVLAAQKRFREAAAAYGEALRRQPISQLVLKQHAMLQAAGAEQQAESLVRRWLETYPEDRVVRFHAAETAVRRKDYKKAAQEYRKVLEGEPGNVAALNNLAWTLGELKDPAALDYARRAHANAPGNARVQDTLGWLLFERGETGKALRLLARAAATAPASPEIRMHLAKALIASGEKESAKRELEAIVRLPATALKAEAQRLLASL